MPGLKLITDYAFRAVALAAKTESVVDTWAGGELLKLHGGHALNIFQRFISVSSNANRDFFCPTTEDLLRLRCRELSSFQLDNTEIRNRRPRRRGFNLNP
ncbi:hypothetical protein CEXT_750831 [Caerostris extrusa]|uniref:Uncharacterized protein n=1 Tax=Caerostris extrusa TaxID=172846 RepID=A0AAV4P194_CAEEX|nr:hypothetical protein CEXT_750831 [Caerostris extrusa]